MQQNRLAFFATNQFKPPLVAAVQSASTSAALAQQARLGAGSAVWQMIDAEFASIPAVIAQPRAICPFISNVTTYRTSAMVAVKYNDLSTAFDFVSYAAPMEHNAYVSLDTGKVYWTSDSYDAFDEDVPDDLDTSDRYLAIPHKNELDLGRSLAMRFIAQELPACFDQVEGFFRRQGAYARLKDLLEREGVLDRWYAFEADSVERALRQWCAENGLEILET